MRREKTYHIEELYGHLKEMIQAAKEKQEAEQAPKVSVEDMNFSTRVESVLRRKKISDCSGILKFKSLNEIYNIRGIGMGCLIEIMMKMQEYGYNAWLEKAIENTDEQLMSFVKEKLGHSEKMQEKGNG